MLMKIRVMIGISWLLAVILAGTLFAASKSHHAQLVKVNTLPITGRSLPFELINTDGKPFSSSALKGKVWTCEFFFATCQGLCPTMQSQMKRAQAALKDEPDFMSISMTCDPMHDTPAKLAAYSKKWDADPNKWVFLTGDKQVIYNNARKGFHLGLDEKAPEKPGDPNDFIHSDRVVLMDREGNIRGIYFGNEASSVDQMVIDIRTLLHEPAK